MERVKKRYKNYILLGVGYNIFGIVAFVGGFVKYFWGTPSVGLTFHYQPIVVDGTLAMVLGVGSLIVGTYRLIFGKKRFLEDRIDELIYEIEKEEKTSYVVPKAAKGNIVKMRNELKLYQIVLRKMNAKKGNKKTETL